MLPEYLTEDDLEALIYRALREDVGPGDVTTEATISPNVEAQGRFLTKEKGILAGCFVAERTFALVDEALEVTWELHDGAETTPGSPVGLVEGAARSILTAERLVLNFMQRMSGIATATRRMQDAADPYGARILDTRKTAPGLRPLDKWAVTLGGGTNHRYGLYDQILIKDNHITAANGISEAIRAANAYRERYDAALPIEIETRTLDEVRAVLDTGAVDCILLDNMARHRPDDTFSTDMLREAVSLVDGRFETEASGNVTLDTVPAIAATGVDYISSGALTHSVQALDISLDVTV